MYNLIQLFLRLSGIFVFVLLEIICFSLVVKYNQTQKDIYTNTVNRGTGIFHSATTNTIDYFSLRDENYRLSRENARLLERLLNAGVDTSGILDTAYTSGLDTTNLDSLGRPKMVNIAPKYTFIGAKVIKNSTRENHNYITLDVGRMDGVVPHSGVITADGVVGVVRQVSHSYSVAMSMLHRQTRVSARVRNKGHFGSMVWKGGLETRRFDLEDIPKHAAIAVGDTVETSGFSAIFPEGVMLGVIETAELVPGSYFYTIKVKSMLDITSVQHVYVVKNLFKKEQTTLEQAVLKEDE